MDDEKYEWLKVARSVDEFHFPENNLLVADLNGKKITIGLHKEQLFACAHLCPHAGGLLASGYIDAMGNVVCPVHGYRFSLITGRNVTGEGYVLRRYPVRISSDGVFIGLLRTPLPS